MSATSERTFIAGLGASGALIAAAGVAALLGVALVAFNGWPSGGVGGDPRAVQAQEVAAAPSRAASEALSTAPAAVAASGTPVSFATPGDPDSVVAPGGGGGGAPVTGGDGGAGTTTPGGTSPGQQVAPVTPGQPTPPGVLDQVADSVNTALQPTAPLLNAVGQTTNQLAGTLNEVVSATPVPGLVGTVAWVVGQTLDQTGNIVEGTINGALGNPGQYP